ncbi:sensor histidine kinase [Patulibacter defluvii]|uniref:sensor histidine kinase n=1 Tax=Patulibacter defluvii TaxID=3095358 RepID=UPI002A751793|nr:HAMP domain-containing sensor histidine kinase [Patulibacter sp. DM4]
MTAGHERVRWLRWLDKLPIRWRLAVVSAGLTGAILLVFAVAVGSFTLQRVRSDFETQTTARFETLRTDLDLRLTSVFPTTAINLRSNLNLLRGERGTAINLWLVDSRNPLGRPQELGHTTPRRDLGAPESSEQREGDLRVFHTRIAVPLRNADGKVLSADNGLIPTVTVIARMGRSYDTVERTSRRIQTALALGVLLGTILALVAGLAVGQRAMRPVKRMTGTARHIARTRDLDSRMPVPPVHDEIAELARTLQDMLDELAASQARIDQSLQRQREFVADASHELRTPLTAVQANLELLALSTDGDDREAAESALRSARRMRRLVSDLLLLARMDAQRETAREPVDLDRAILEAVDELEPQFGGHEIVLDLDPLTVDGVRDELVRMVANLLGNALRHTPDGTEIRIRLREIDRRGELVVEDDGPGIPPELRDRIFDRFVRHGGEGAGSTGIGLAIVRAAAQRHGGDVRLESTSEDGSGARFVITLALAAEPTTVAPADDDRIDPDGPPVDAEVAAAAGEDGRLLGPSRRAARQIRRRLRGDRATAAGPADAEERLGGAAPDDV